MDFATMRTKFCKFEYTKVAQFLRDIHLVFTNCTQYNQPSAPEAKAGQRLSKYVERRIAELKLESDDDGIPQKRSRRTL